MFGDWIDPSPEPVTSIRRLQPIAATYSAFKVAENESPRPLGRLFVTYNFYRRVLGTQDLHRETVGVEKTIFDGGASLGLRVPFFQIDRGRAAHGPVVQAGERRRADDRSVPAVRGVPLANRRVLRSGSCRWTFRRTRWRRRCCSTTSGSAIGCPSVDFYAR